MKLSSISRKFLFSPKSHSLVNLVAIVSVVALLVPTAAMIIVLSLQNGLSSLLHDTYKTFDPELKVTPHSGQYFEVDSAKIAEIETFATVSKLLEVNVVATKNDYSSLLTLRGVDSLYGSVTSVPEMVTRGRWRTALGDLPRAVVGATASYNLALSLGVGQRLSLTTIIPTPRFLKTPPIVNTKSITPDGVFAIESQIDSKYIFTNLDFVRSFLGRYDVLSSLEIKPNIDTKSAKTRIEEILGDTFDVRTRSEQRATLFKAIEAEKLIIFVILIFVAIIAAMSLSGCILMMTTEKAQSAAVLRSLGMSERKVRGVFQELGMRIVVLGVGLGLVLGVSLVLAQQYFEVLQMGQDVFTVNTYPVEIQTIDVLATTLSMVAVGYAIVYLTIRKLRF